MSSPRPDAPIVLVLGATGYVGGRLVPELLAHGHRVRCLVRTPPTGLPWTDDVELVTGDLTEPGLADRVTRGCGQEALQGTGGDGLFYCFAAN